MTRWANSPKAVDCIISTGGGWCQSTFEPNYDMEHEKLDLGVAGRTTTHFITMARIPLTRLEPMDGQRPIIQSNLDGIRESLSEENAAMRDVHPLGVVVTRGDGMEEFKRRLSEQSLDRVLSFEGIPKEYKLKVYSGFHRFTAASLYIEAHRDDSVPPSAATRSWLCVVYDADVADDPDLPVLMVAHNIEAIHSNASIKEWIHSLQFSGNDPTRIKTAIGLTAHGGNVSNLYIVRCSMLWEPLVTYGTLEFNKSLNLSIVASWGGYCAEFEILTILLEDAVRQQRHIATFKKESGPLTSFDIFGKVWGENGHRQSGDMENVKKDWEKAKIDGFGTAKSTWSFSSFWKRAIVDENEQAFLFGDVIFVPEDLRGDPKGGKRKDMAGYVILTRARAALSCLSALLFAGDFEYRCVRTPTTVPDPWVATIMEKQGVDVCRVDEFIRQLVPWLGALITDSQVKGQLQHQVAHDIFKKNGHTEETLHQMVWTEITDTDCHAAWEQFLLICEEAFGFGRHEDLWNIVTEITDAKDAAKASTRKSARQKATQGVDVIKEKVGSTKKGGSQGRRRQVPPSSSDSDEEVQITSQTRRKGRTYKSKDDPIPQKTRNSGRIAALPKLKRAVEEEEEEADKNKDRDVPMADFVDNKDPSDQITMDPPESDPGDESMGQTLLTNNDNDNDEDGQADLSIKRVSQPRGYSHPINPTSPLANPGMRSSAMFATSNARSELGSHPTLALLSRPSSSITNPLSLESTPSAHTAATAQEGTSQNLPPTSKPLATTPVTPTPRITLTNPTVPARQTPSNEDTMMLDRPQVGGDDKDTLDMELLTVTARIENEVARWREVGNGPKALELLMSLAKQLALGP